MKKALSQIKLPALSLMLVISFAALTLSSLQIHLLEMQLLLQRDAYLENGLGQTSMAAKFINQMKLYRQQISRAQADEQEHALGSMHSQNAQIQQDWTLAKNMLDAANIPMINFVRRMMGQAELPNGTEMQLYDRLDEAFSLERAKEYDNALLVYGQILTKNMALDNRQMSLIALHQGFCLAVLGDTTQARRKFRDVMQNESRSNLGVTASILIAYMDAMVLESQQIREQGLTDARRLTDLLQCDAAANVLDHYQPVSNEDKAEVSFLRGRCLEERGLKDRAAMQYFRAVKVAKRSPTARDANRRLFMVGTQVPDGGRPLQVIARDLNKHLQDSTLMRMEKRPVENQERSRVHGVARLLVPLDTLGAIKREALVLFQDTVRPLSLPPPLPKKNLPVQGAMVRLEVTGGKWISGELLSKPGEKLVRVRTMVGDIGVEVHDIRSLEVQ